MEKKTGNSDRKVYRRLSYKTYYLKNRDRILAKHRERYRKNKDEINERRREQYKKNREKVLARRRELYRGNKKKLQMRMRTYERKHKLTTKSGVIRGIKRPYPSNGKCEMCGKKTRLVYHHWKIIGNVIYGVWICQGRYACHPFVELYEKGLLNEYLKLKTFINNSNPNTWWEK